MKRHIPDGLGGALCGIERTKNTTENVFEVTCLACLKAEEQQEKLNYEFEVEATRAR